MQAATLITGASSGIGAALARRLALQEDCGLLILTGRNPERLEAVALECRQTGACVLPVILDQSDRNAVFEALASIEAQATVERVFANAGILEGRPADDSVETSEQASRVVDTNLLSTIELIYAVLPGMRQRGRGEIALVSSLAAFSPIADAPAYSASKAGLVAFGLALRDAVSPEGIRVVVSCPGYVGTPMGEIHIGHRPGEVSADAAASHIVSALRANKAISGFPLLLYWLARTSLWVPEFVRRFGSKGLRFYVASHVHPKRPGE